MKVQIAVIKLVLRTNKVLSDGSHPIMLRVSFNGMKERSTGYSCTPRFWDKKSECVKKGYQNFVMVNFELKKLKDEAIARRDKYIASNEVYTPQMILAKEEVRNAVTNDFRGLIQRYIDEKGLEDRTIEKWWIVCRNVLLFADRKQLLVNEINEAFCRRYCRWLENDVLIRTMLMYNDGEYFLPTLQGFDGDIRKRVNNVYSGYSENLVRWFQRINEEIVRRNVENDDNIPLIDLDCRYYSYRHSYIMKEIQKPTVNLLALAQTVGKSATTLHQYISLLGDVDLVE